MRTKFLPAGLILVLSIVSANCAVTLRGSFQDQCKTEGWTNDQCDVAFYYGVRQKFAKEDGNGGYIPTYNALTREQVLKIQDTRLQELNDVLDYKNRENDKFLKEFELRKYLEHQEKIFKAGRDRLQLVDIHNRFKEFMGELSYRPGHDRFSTSSLFVEDLTKSYPFTSNQIEEARANKTLQEIGKTMWFSEMTLGRKEPDPNDPDDQNKFIWKPIKVGVELVSYKVMDGQTPKENTFDYVEGTRFEVADNGTIKREKLPSVKVFVSGNSYSIVVIDKDKEGEIGFSIPDFVDQTSRLNSAEQLMGQSLFERLFYEPQNQKRTPPRDPPPVVVEIAPVGSSKIDVWETNANGWSVPARYKNDRSDNYSVNHKLKGSEQENFDHSNPNKQIDYLRKMWAGVGDGRVIEYFRAKSPYDQPNLSQISIYEKNIRLVTVDGNVEEGVITPNSNKWIQDKPHQISYTLAGTRWMLWDEDGDGKYEKKRQISEAGEK